MNDILAEAHKELLLEGGIDPDAADEEEEAGIGDRIAHGLGNIANIPASIGSGIIDSVFSAKDAIFGEPEEDEKSDFRKNREALHEQNMERLDNNEIVNAWKSVGTGGMKAGYEVKDFIVGEPEEHEKSELRQEMEARSDHLRSKGMSNNVVEGISQFTFGLLGAGKLLAPVKAVQKVRQAGKAGQVAYEVGRGAIVGATALDPHEDRLSNLIQSYPSLENPVTEFLAASEDDSAAMGRFKNALEGIGLDLAIVGTFALGVKALKSAKNGNMEAALADLKKAEQSQVEVSKPDMEAEIEQIMKAELEAPKRTDIDVVSTEAKAITAEEAVDDYQPRVDIDDADLEKILKTSRDESAIIKRYGSKEEAQKQGHKFAGYNIPWQKIDSSIEVQTLVDNVATVLKKQFDEAKGGAVLTDARVKAMVRDSAELFGEDPEALVGELLKAGDSAKEMVANMESSYIIAKQMFEDASSLAKKIEMGLLDDFGGNPEVAKEEVKKMFQAAADIMSSGLSMRSAAGRSLRRMRSEFSITPEDVASFSSLDGDQLVDVLSKAGGDLRKLKQTVQPGFWRKVNDEATFLLTNNLLWFYPTHLVNLSTNLYMLAARPIERYIGSYVLGGRGSAIREQAALELAHTTNSLGDAWTAMVEAFKRGDSSLNPHQNEYFEGAAAQANSAPVIEWKPISGVWDLFENAYKSVNYRTIVGLPTRSLGAVDEFIKTLKYRAIVQSRAVVEARRAGMDTDATKAHIQAALDGAFTPDGRALDDLALVEAQIATFQQELLPNTVGAGVRNFRQSVPVTSMVLPFVKTPINVLRYAWKMTPGLNLLQGEYRQMMKGAMGPEAQAQAIGQVAMGSLFMSLSASLAMSGKITGGGPSDPALKKQLQATGWQPYSFVIDKEDGTKQYVPIGRFDPVGMPFGMVADLVDMMVLHPNTKEAEKGTVAVAVALAKSFSEKTFLLNINQLLRAMTEPEKNMEKFLGNLTGNLIPGSSALRNYANSDPYLREARGLIDNTLKGLPAYSETLPPQRDAFGEPMWRKRSLTTNSSEDAVEAEHNRIIMETGQGIRPPSPNRGGIDLRDFTLSDGRNAYDKLQELAVKPTSGRSLKQALLKTIQSEGYQHLVDGDSSIAGTKLGALSSIVRKYRSAAYKVLLAKHPELRKELAKQQLKVRETVMENRKASSDSNQGNVEELLKSLGY